MEFHKLLFEFNNAAKPEKPETVQRFEFRIERRSQPHQLNPAMLRQILTNEGFRVFQWGERPETVCGMHKNLKNRSHWIISGALEIHIENKEPYVLEAGDRDFLPAGTYHTSRVIGEEFAIYLVGEK